MAKNDRQVLWVNVMPDSGDPDVFIATAEYFESHYGTFSFIFAPFVSFYSHISFVALNTEDAFSYGMTPYGNEEHIMCPYAPYAGYPLFFHLSQSDSLSYSVILS